MCGNSHTLRTLAAALAAAGAFASVPALGAGGSYGLLPVAAGETGGTQFVLGVNPLSRDPLSAPVLGTGPYGLGFAGSANSWKSGLDQWEGRATQDQPVGGVFVAPGVSYRASSNLAVGAGVGLRYDLAPAGSSELPAALRYPTSGGSGLRGADLNLGLRYAVDPGTEVGLAYRSRFKDDAWSQRYPMTSYADFAIPGVQVPGASVPQAVSATLSHQFGERWALTGALGWQEIAQAEGSAFSQGATLRGGEAWFAGVGARYALRENLGVGMSMEYLYGSGLDPVRRNLVPAASLSGDGSYYFFGLDLNWRF